MNIIAYGTVEVRLIHEVSEAVVVKKTQEGAEIELGFDRDIGADQPARVGGLSRHTEVSHCWPNLAKSQNRLKSYKTGMLAKGVQSRPQIDWWASSIACSTC